MSEPLALDSLPESLSGASLNTEDGAGSCCRGADLVGVVEIPCLGLVVLGFVAFGVLVFGLALGVVVGLGFARGGGSLST